MITRQALEEFTEIYKKEFGVELPPKIALELATRVLLQFKVIYRPIKKDRKSDTKQKH